MTLLKLIQTVSEVITPKSEAFYEYVIHTSDDNGGFLRTRYCWRDKPLRDRELLYRDISAVVVSMKQPMNAEDLLVRSGTRIKMQFHYDGNNTEEDAVLDASMGYNYVYVIDIVNKTFEMNYMESPY